jgi:hypothetical protein
MPSARRCSSTSAPPGRDVRSCMSALAQRSPAQASASRTPNCALRRRPRFAAPSCARTTVTRPGCQGAAIHTELDQKMATRLEYIGVVVPRCAARVLGKPIGVEPGRSLCVCADRATCASNQRMKPVHARPCGQPARQAYVLVRAGAPPGTRTPNPRIKSSSGARSPAFMSVRAAGQEGCAYSGELSRTAVNCNPKLQPRALTIRPADDGAESSDVCQRRANSDPLAAWRAGVSIHVPPTMLAPVQYG